MKIDTILLLFIIIFLSATICLRQAFRCALQCVYTIELGHAAPLLLTSMHLGGSASLLLSSHPGGVWLGYAVAHTRQEGGPLPTQWLPFPATTTSNSLQLSSRTRVKIQVLVS